jgi:hypothetical protein
LRYLEDCIDNIVVGSASAEISAHLLLDHLLRQRPALAEQGDRGHDLTGRAEAALEGVVLDEGRLEWMRMVWISDALDRLNGSTGDRRSEG